MERLVRNQARFSTQILQRVANELPPVDLVPIQAELGETVGWLLRAAFLAQRNRELLDEDSVHRLRQMGERWWVAAVSFGTVATIAQAATAASVELTRELSQDREARVTVDVIGHGVLIAQQVVIAVSHGYARAILRSATTARRATEAKPTVHLRGMSREVLRMVASGHTNIEIARELTISKQAVNYHVGRLMRTLGAANRAALVGNAYEAGVLPLS